MTARISGDCHFGLEADPFLQATPLAFRIRQSNFAARLGNTTALDRLIKLICAWIAGHLSFNMLIGTMVIGDVWSCRLLPQVISRRIMSV